MKTLRFSGDALHQARWDAELTRPELARKAGCTVSMLSMVEGGTRVPSVALLCRLVGALDIDMGAVFVDATPQPEGVPDAEPTTEPTTEPAA